MNNKSSEALLVPLDGREIIIGYRTHTNDQEDIQEVYFQGYNPETKQLAPNPEIFENKLSAGKKSASYIYDRVNNKKKKTILYSGDGQTTASVTVYNEFGNPSRETTYKDGAHVLNVIKYTYHDDQALKQKTTYRDDERTIAYSEEYNVDGKISAFIQHAGKEVESVIEYIYHPETKYLAKKNHYKGARKLLTSTDLYNHRGLLIEKVEFAPHKGEGIIDQLKKYEYDENTNLKKLNILKKIKTSHIL